MRSPGLFVQVILLRHEGITEYFFSVNHIKDEIEILKLFQLPRHTHQKSGLHWQRKPSPFSSAPKYYRIAPPRLRNYNPLKKLPVLIFEYLEAKYPEKTPLLPQGPGKIDAALFAKRIEVKAEAQRESDKRSEQWMTGQRRKIDGGLEAIADWLVDAGNPHFLIDDTFSITDITA